jgi:hypothetical protein
MERGLTDGRQRSNGSDVIENRAAGSNLALIAADRLFSPKLRTPPSKPKSRRSRLGLLLIVIPTLAAVALAGTRLISSVRSAAEYQRVAELADLGSAVTDLVQRVEDERDQTVDYIALDHAGRAGELAGHHKAAAAGLRGLTEDYGAATGLLPKVTRGLREIGKAFSGQTGQRAQLSTSLLTGLPALRDASTRTALPAQVVMQKYTSLIDGLLHVDDQIAFNSSDPVLDNAVRALSLISRIDEEASEQRALLAEAFTTESFGPGVLTSVSDARIREQAILQVFQATATPGQRALYRDAVSSPSVDEVAGEEDLAINMGQEGRALGTDATTVDEWMGSMTVTIDLTRKVESDLVNRAAARARALHRSAIMAGIASAVLVALLALCAVVTIVGRAPARLRAN